MSTNYPFRPSTAIDLLLVAAHDSVVAAERAVEAYDETTPRIMEVDPQGCTYITYPDESPRTEFYEVLAPDDDDEEDTEEVSVHIQLGERKIVAEFETEATREEVQEALAEQLSAHADADNSLVVGPLIIPARYVPGIVFASVRTLAEAEAFGVHLNGNG